jgi:hypothetical protein
MRRRPHSFAQRKRREAEFLVYCGTKDPDEYHITKTARFMSEVKSLGEVVKPARNRRKGNLPASATDGAGMFWLRLFADYEGDKCLLFPFRTAYCPRGTVTYNFRAMPAHRAMCLHAHKLPEDESKTMALHRCGNGHLGCVNPNHLYWGDQSDNIKDAHRHAQEGKQAA